MCSLGYRHAFLLSTAGVVGYKLHLVGYINTHLAMHGSMNVIFSFIVLGITIGQGQCRFADLYVVLKNL